MRIVPEIDMRVVPKIDLRIVPKTGPKNRCGQAPRVGATSGHSWCSALGDTRKLTVHLNDVLLHGVVLRLACDRVRVRRRQNKCEMKQSKNRNKNVPRKR